MKMIQKTIKKVLIPTWWTPCPPTWWTSCSPARGATLTLCNTRDWNGLQMICCANVQKCKKGKKCKWPVEGRRVVPEPGRPSRVVRSHGLPELQSLVSTIKQQKPVPTFHVDAKYKDSSISINHGAPCAPQNARICQDLKVRAQTWWGS